MARTSKKAAAGSGVGRLTPEEERVADLELEVVELETEANKLAARARELERILRLVQGEANEGRSWSRVERLVRQAWLSP